MDKRKNSKYNKKYNILFAIAAVIILIYMMVAIIRLIKSPMDVFIIEYGKVAQEEPSTGYLIREETIVKGNNYENGLIPIKSEGEKTSKGDAVFRYYSSDEEVITKQIEEIDLEINEVLEQQTIVFTADIKALDEQIEKKLNGINKYTDTEKIREYKNDINTYLSKKSKLAGENSPAGSYIKQLYEERSIYEAKLNQTTEYVNAPTSGVVSYRVDNLENILTTDNFTNLNKRMLEDLNVKTGQIIATNNQEGKIINNFECYIASIMTSENAINSVERSKSKIEISK